MTKAKFVVKSGDAGFHFTLVSPNGETILVSEVYTSMQACLKGIKAVKRYSGEARVEKPTVK